MPAVDKRTKGEAVAVDKMLQGGKMLETIKLPRNLHILSDRLPKPNYEEHLKKCPSIPEAIQEEEPEKKVYHSHQPTPTNIEAQKKVLPPKPQSKERPIEQPKYQLPPRNPLIQNHKSAEQQKGKPPIQQVNRVPYHKNPVQKPIIKGRSESSQRHNKYQPKPTNVPLSARGNQKLPADKYQVQNPGNQKIQRRVASVGTEKRQENNRKLVEYYKNHPVKAGINMKGLEANKKPSQKPIHEVKKPPIQKKNPPSSAKGRPAPANIYPSWWG